MAASLVHIENRNKKYKVQNGWSVTAICVDNERDAKTLFTGHDNGCIVTWDLIGIKPKDLKQPREIKAEMCWIAHSAPVTGICYFHVTGQLGTSSLDKTVKIWDSTNPTNEREGGPNAQLEFHQLGQQFKSKWKKGLAKVKNMGLMKRLGALGAAASGAPGSPGGSVAGSLELPAADADHLEQLEQQRQQGKMARKASGVKAAIQANRANRKSSIMTDAGSGSTPGSPTSP